MQTNLDTFFIVFKGEWKLHIYILVSSKLVCILKSWFSKQKLLGAGDPWGSRGVGPPKNLIFSILWKDYINLNLKNKLTICFGPTYFYSKLPKIFFLRLQDMWEIIKFLVPLSTNLTFEVIQNLKDLAHQHNHVLNFLSSL